MSINYFPICELVIKLVTKLVENREFYIAHKLLDCLATISEALRDIDSKKLQL